MARETIIGLNALIKDIKKLDKMPQSQINKGARRGANVILHEARAIAPKKTGKLAKKITLKAERSKRGKKVYQITMQKVEKYPESVKIGKDGTRYYYPASQNYGFKTRNGGHVAGKHFLGKALQNKGAEASRVMVEEISKEIDKALREGKI